MRDNQENREDGKERQDVSRTGGLSELDKPDNLNYIYIR